MELRLRIPQRTDQLTHRQLKAISLLLLMGYSETEFLVKALFTLSSLQLLVGRTPDRDGARWYTHPSLKNPFLMEPDKVAAMADNCRFLLEGGEIHPLRWIRLARSRHFRLYNANFEQYLMAENYYFAWMQTNDTTHLDNLIAVLYRKPWQRWNAGKIQKRARYYSNIAPEVKNSVFLWYAGFRKLVERRCPNLYSKKGSSEKLNVSEYLNGMIHALNNNDITRNPDLMKQPVWDALNEMEQRALEAVKMKEALTKKH